MIRTVTLVAFTFFLAGCAAMDCSRSLCGCSSAASQPVALRLTDIDRSIVANARLICHDDGSFLGQTDSDGLLKLQVQGANTPGCGFMPDCQVAYFRTDNDSFGRHFWFARFVRGESVSAKAHAVERVDSED